MDHLSLRRIDQSYNQNILHIWNQIVDNISSLDPQYVPIIMLMEATGFHLIDILTLKFDCLSFGEDGVWIESINVLEKRISEFRVMGRTRSIEILEPKLKKFKEIRSSLNTHNNNRGQYVN